MAALKTIIGIFFKDRKYAAKCRMVILRCNGQHLVDSLPSFTCSPLNTLVMMYSFLSLCF